MVVVKAVFFAFVLVAAVGCETRSTAGAGTPDPTTTPTAPSIIKTPVNPEKLRIDMMCTAENGQTRLDPAIYGRRFTRGLHLKVDIEIQRKPSPTDEAWLERQQISIISGSMTKADHWTLGGNGMRAPGRGGSFVYQVTVTKEGADRPMARMAGKLRC